MIYLPTLFLIDGYIIVIINNSDINNVSNIIATATSFIMIAICADINECTSTRLRQSQNQLVYRVELAVL